MLFSATLEDKAKEKIKGKLFKNSDKIINI